MTQFGELRHSRCKLPDSETISADPIKRPKRRLRAFLRWAWALPLLFLLWLDGPGVRFLAPRVAGYYLGKAGYQGEFEVVGRLTGGLMVRDLKIKGAGAGLRIARIVPEYRWAELLRGRLDGLALAGGAVDLDLSGSGEGGVDAPLDLQNWLGGVRALRAQLVPMNLQVGDLAISAKSDGAVLFRLDSSALSHRAGSDEFEFRLGEITDVTGKDWPKQEFTMVWRDESLEIPRIDPLPGVSFRDFRLLMPSAGEVGAEVEVRMDEAVFRLGSSADFQVVRVDLIEGSWALLAGLQRFGVQVPVAAELSSLSIELENVLPNPRLVRGTCRILLENVEWDEWAAPELSLDVELGAEDVSVAARGMIPGSEIVLNAGADVERDGGGFQLGLVRGDFSLADFAGLVKALAGRVEGIDAGAEVPASLVRGDFSVGIATQQVTEASATIEWVPAEIALASGISLVGKWRRGDAVDVALAMDGVSARANYQETSKVYQAHADFEGFSSERIAAWMKIFKWTSTDQLSLDGKWHGRGDLAAGTHQGGFLLRESEWRREGMQSIQGMGNLNYNWPHGLEAEDVRLKMGSQTLAMNAGLENQRFSVRDFVWSDGEQELAEGSASFPIPEDLNQWREMLADDQSAVSAKVTSQALSLGLLKEWVPALEKLDARSTGMVDLSVSGTYASPVVDVKVEVKELRSQQHPELPPADLAIALRGRDGQMRLDGAVQVPDFPVAVIGASMGFSPKEWLDDPGRFMRENVEANLDLPELELSRFGSLIPGVDQLAGKVRGKLELSGEIGDPKAVGGIELTGGVFSWKNSRFPKLEGLSGGIDLSRQEIRLRALRGDVAGGNITGEGWLKVEDGKLIDMDFRMRADHVPIVRNDLFLLRVNADLRLLGPWDGAILSGGVEAVDSIFYRDIELLPIGTPFTAVSAAALPKLDAPSSLGASFPAPMGDWGLNLTVAALEPILIRGNLANGDVRGSVRIGGTLGKPAPQGKLMIRDFSAALPFSKFVVRSGTATFTPDAGFDPILEIRGTANPRPYRVTGYVYGRASNPQLVLTSSPPLPDHEIVTLLATGATTSGLEDPQAASSRALQLLVEELRRGRFRLGKSLRPVLGLLDRVDFSLAESDPYTSDSFSTATLSITDRWFLSAGMGATGDTRIFAIWRLSFY